MANIRTYSQDCTIILQSLLLNFPVSVIKVILFRFLSLCVVCVCIGQMATWGNHFSFHLYVGSVKQNLSGIQAMSMSMSMACAAIQVHDDVCGPAADVHDR